MNRSPRKRREAAVNPGVLVAMGLFLVTAMMVWAASPVPSNKPAAYPAWWFERDVIKRANTNVSNPAWPTNYLTSDDYATLNSGQLKTLASKAYAELQDKLSAANWQGATNAPGPKLSSLIQSWSTNTAAGDNYAVVNQGQLKNVAKSFYDVLGQAGYVSGLGLPPVGWTNGAYPWSSSTNSPDAYAAANIGQAKRLFSFDLTQFSLLDSDGDNLPDEWELEFGLNLDDDDENNNGSLDGLDDFDGDGLTNRQEYLQGSNPLDYYSQGSNTITPSIAILSGNNQTGNVGKYLSASLNVEVRSGSSTGLVLTNAPVTYTVTNGGGALSTVFGGTTTSVTLPVLTGTNGVGSAWYRQGSADAAVNTIAVSTGTATPVIFSSTTVDLVGHWKFDEASGSVAADSAPFNFTGTLISGPTWAERYTGEGNLNFSGTNSHVLVGSGTNTLLDFASADFSVVAWVKSGTSAQAGRIVSKGAESANAGYFLGLNAQGQLEAGLGTTQFGTAVETIRINTSSSFNDDAWHSVAAVFDRANATAKIYVDGTARSLVQQAGTGGTITVSGSTQLDFGALQYLNGSRSEIPLTIASHSGTSAFFKGGIDDVRMYRKALSAAEVQSLHTDTAALIAVPMNVTINEDITGDFQLQHQGGGNSAPVYSLVNNTVNGQTTLVGGALKYIPDANFSGTDAFRFRVTKGGRTAEANGSITIVPVNDAPWVSVGGGQSVTMSGTTATLTLNATVTDVDTPTANIQLTWMKVSGTGTVTFSGTNPLATTAVFGAVGEYLVRLSANDGSATRSDTLIVSVNASGTSAMPNTSMVAPVNSAEFLRNEAVTLKASASVASPASISKVEFFYSSKKIGEVTSPNGTSGLYELVWSPPRAGVYGLTARAIDSLGNYASSSMRTIYVLAGPGDPPEPPVGPPGNGGATSTNPGDDNDGDGLSNAVEDEVGTDPEIADQDGDDIPDGEDAVPTVNAMRVKAAPESNYAIIDLGANSTPGGVNDSGVVRLVSANTQKIWTSGSSSALQLPEGQSMIVVGPMQDGAVYALGSQETFAGGASTRKLYTVSSAGSAEAGISYSKSIAAALYNDPDIPNLPTTPGVFSGAAEAELGSKYSSVRGPLQSAANAHDWHSWQVELIASVVGITDGGRRIVRGSIDVVGFSYYSIEPDGPYNLGLAGGARAGVVGWTISGGSAVGTSSSSMFYSDSYAGININSASGIQPSNFWVNDENFPIYTTGTGSATQGVGNSQNIPQCLGTIDLNLKKQTTEGPYVLGRMAYSKSGVWCYNGGGWENIQINADVAGGGAPSRNISNNLVVPLGEMIWRNSRMRSLAELCGVPATGTTGWTNPKATMVTPDNNLLIGTAKKDGVSHGVLLVPVNITIKKKNSDNPPRNGLVVRTFDIVTIALSNIPAEQFPALNQNIKWFVRQLKNDGTYTEWADLGVQYRGVSFDFPCFSAGIYQIKCEWTVGSQQVVTIFDRDFDDPDTRNNEKLRAGDPDSFGVAENQWQINLRNKAASYLGSATYAESVDNPPIPAGNHKCNIFVANMAAEASVFVPWINGTIYQFYPPVANQWFGSPALPPAYPAYEDYLSEFWTLVEDPYPQPGYIVARGFYTWGTGHCAITDYDGRWIGTSDSLNLINRQASFSSERGRDLQNNQLLPAMRKTHND